MDSLGSYERSLLSRLSAYAVLVVALLLAAVSAQRLSAGLAAEALLAHVCSTAAVAAGVYLLQRPCGALMAARVALGAGLVVGFLPGAGLAGVLLVAIPSWLVNARPRPVRAIPRAMPAFTPQLLHETRLPGPTSHRSLSPDRPLDERIAAVRSIRHMESARAVTLLRTALADPAEDVRLLAHALLERRERSLRAELESALRTYTQLEAEHAPDSVRAPLDAKLASLYWELSYAGFVHGDGAQKAREKAAHHALRSCRTPGHNASILIAIRALLQTGELARACLALGWAERAGLPKVALAPLAAELAFLDRRFDRIHGQLADLAQLASSKPELDQVVRFWSQRRHAS